jgi:hypothetical protein
MNKRNALQFQKQYFEASSAQDIISNNLNLSFDILEILSAAADGKKQN